MNATRVSYTLDSSLESVNKAEETANDIATKSGFESEEVQRISMAVREAAVNAVLHGNSYDPRKKVHIAFETTPSALTITIRDEGKGLDTEKGAGAREEGLDNGAPWPDTSRICR